LVIFAVVWSASGRPQPRHEPMMPLLSFSGINVFYPTKPYFPSGKRSASYLIIIDKHLIKYLSSTVNRNITFTDVVFKLLPAKNIYLTYKIIFRYADSEFPQLYCPINNCMLTKLCRLKPNVLVTMTNYRGKECVTELQTTVKCQ